MFDIFLMMAYKFVTINFKIYLILIFFILYHSPKIFMKLCYPIRYEDEIDLKMDMRQDKCYFQ